MGQQHDFYLVQSGNLVPRAALWRGFLACFQQPSLLRPANLDSSDATWNPGEADETTNPALAERDDIVQINLVYNFRLISSPIVLTGSTVTMGSTSRMIVAN